MKSPVSRFLALFHSIKTWTAQRMIQMRYQMYIWRGYRLGNHVVIGSGVQLSRNVKIGEHVTLVGNSHLQGEIHIGNHVIIARGCTIMATNHDYERGDALPYGTAYINKKVIIEDYVWLGENVNIVPGICIGEGAVIGLGSVVTKDVPPLAVAAGNPARVIKYRDAEHFQRLKQERKYLNLIRGAYSGRSADMRRNRSHFKELLQKKGFVLNDEIQSTRNEWRSSILYWLARERTDTIFGNAENYHIALLRSSLEEIPTLIERLAATIHQLRPEEPADSASLESDLLYLKETINQLNMQAGEAQDNQPAPQD